MKTILWEYPSNEVGSVFFWIERKDSVEKPWLTMALIDPGSGTNVMAFFRVGVDWRTNAPAWVTNFQFVELPPEPSPTKLLTAGSKAGKLSTPLKLPPKTYRAVAPPTPPR